MENYNSPGGNADVELQIFSNPDFGEIRTLTIGGEPWFVGKDVAAALGYRNHRQAISSHIDTEDKGVQKLDTPSGDQEMVIINESGLYSLILSSKLPTAKRFKRWVTSEVLPSLRKTGTYSIVAPPFPTAPRALTTDDYLKAASIVAGCRNERLPYVLHYLELGGFEPPRIASTSVSAEVQSDALRLIWDAKTRYGLSCAQIGKPIGVDRIQVSGYVNGTRKPAPQRAALIKERLTGALAQIQET